MQVQFKSLFRNMAEYQRQRLIRISKQDNKGLVKSVFASQLAVDLSLYISAEE